jgi:hypothetical protein
VPFKLLFQEEAEHQLEALKKDGGLAKRLKAVNRALGFLQTNPRHVSLHTHKYDSLTGPNGEDVFEAYAENVTPAAYRVFWFYGSDEFVGTGKQAKRIPVITIVAITPHL